jgi:uncharacterized protein
MEEQTMRLLNKTFMLAAVLVVGVLVFFVGHLVLQQKLIDQQSNYQITVTGQGKVYAKPDVAVVSLGVTTDGKTVAEVTKNNTEKMNAVISAIKDLKIDEKDIQTTNYNLSPVYETITTNVYDEKMSAISSVAPLRTSYSSNKVTGYKLSQNVEVKIRDFTKIGDVLSKSTDKGANVVGDLQFTIDNVEKVKEEARAKAIEQAKANAKNLAEKSGVKLGKIINVYENNYYSPVYSSVKGMGGAAMDSVSAPSPTIQPGQQEVDLTVNLTYQVR